MKFGPVPVAEAEGAVLAHSVMAGEKRYRKAHRLVADDVSALRAAGVSEVVVARLDPGDLGEDAAAEAIAATMQSHGIETKPAATGRVNLHAEVAGLFTVDKALIDAINAVDPAVTIATVANHAAVVVGQMVATVKIIPFAVAGSIVERVLALLAAREVFAVHPFRVLKVGVVQTVLPGVKDSVLDKTLRVTEQRLARSSSRLVAERRTAHDSDAVAKAAIGLAESCDLTVIFGASAMADPDDVIPAAIRQAGGKVLRAGMPVDPGNLLILGELAGKPVLGAPGCARSPKENGFDWVLDRLIAGIDVTDGDIAGMGVGGLLMEIPTRPQPREAPPKAKPVEVHAVVLAAGRSSRMGGPNKLLALFDGQPLVRQTVARVQASRAGGPVVVTGHQHERVRDALAGVKVNLVRNAAFATGLASSLKAGIAALPPSADAAMIVLGDMPCVSVEDFDRLIASFVTAGGAVVRATFEGKRGNPVIIPRSLFPAVGTLEGDTGARSLIEAEGAAVVDVEIGAGASIDVDTPEALQRAGGVLQG